MKKVEVLTRQALRQLSVVQPTLEIIDWVLYDTKTLAIGGTATSLKFFQQAVGQAGITKEQTNMEIPGQLPSGHKFVAQKIVCQPLADAFAGAATNFVDLYNATHRGYASFNVGSRPYLECHVLDLIGGTFQASCGTIDYAAARTVVNGEMEYSPVIPANYAFNVEFVYPTAPTVTGAVNVRVKIIGKMVRPRQG